MSSSNDLPPSAEIFPIAELVRRHPTFLSLNRARWAIRKRQKNGLAAAGAVFASRAGELLVSEPLFIRWFLLLDGREKPRASRRRKPK